MILFVAAEFPPIKTIGRIRAAKFVQHLSQAGHDLIVLTVEAGVGQDGYDPSLEHEVPDGVTVVRAPRPNLEEAFVGQLKALTGRKKTTDSPQGRLDDSTSSQSTEPPVRGSAGFSAKQAAIDAFKWALRNWVEVPDDYCAWASHAQSLAGELCHEHNIELVFTSLPPFSAARVGYALKRKLGIPWVIDYRDLWYGDVLREWVGPVRRRFELMQERRYVRAADAVVAVSEQKTEFLKQLHPHADVRWETLTNGYDSEIYEPFLAEGRTADATVDFVFTGRLFKNRRGYAFAEALGQLVEEDPELRGRVRVHILGGVAPEIRERYEDILKRYGIEEMYRFMGDVSYYEAIRAQVQADYLLLIVDTGATSSGVIPGKLFEYISARRPILALTDPGATQEIIERGRLGTAVPAESVETCKRVLGEWLRREVPESLDADWSYLAQFERRIISRRLGELFDDIIEAADRKSNPG